MLFSKQHVVHSISVITYKFYFTSFNLSRELKCLKSACFRTWYQVVHEGIARVREVRCMSTSACFHYFVKKSVAEKCSEITIVR